METNFFSPFFRESYQCFFFVWNFSVMQKRLSQWNISFWIMETDSLPSGNRFPLFRCFSSRWTPSLKLVESSFWRITIFRLLQLIFWLIETIFFHFFREQSTVTRGSSLFFNWNIFFSQFFILASGNEFFFADSTVLFWGFSCYWRLLLKLGKSQFSKTNYILASGRKYFKFFQRFCKVEANFSESGKVFFNTLHLASANRLSGYRKQYFLVRAILLLVETIIGITRKYLSKNDLILASGPLIFWPGETGF